MLPPPPLRLLPSAPPEPARSDDYLMSLAAAGQEGAFTELVARHERGLRAFCECVVGDRALSRDLAQDVFLQLWEARGRYRPQGRFKELLFTAAQNRCRSHLRRRWLRGLLPLEHPEVSLHQPALAGPEEGRLEQERDLLVRRALGRLPERFRVPLALRFVEAMEYEEIARVIGRTPSAARSRIHYGLKALALELPWEVADGLP